MASVSNNLQAAKRSEPGHPGVTRMKESISEIGTLLREIVDHLKVGTTTEMRKAAAKLERLAALASTLALTIQATRR